MIESNISRDHIALEAMKCILTKTVLPDRKFVVFGNYDTMFPNEKIVAECAYDYADAMIAERNKRKEYEED